MSRTFENKAACEKSQIFSMLCDQIWQYYCILGCGLLLFALSNDHIWAFSDLARKIFQWYLDRKINPSRSDGWHFLLYISHSPGVWAAAEFQWSHLSLMTGIRSSLDRTWCPIINILLWNPQRWFEVLFEIRLHCVSFLLILPCIKTDLTGHVPAWLSQYFSA